MPPHRRRSRAVRRHRVALLAVLLGSVAIAAVAALTGVTLAVAGDSSPSGPAPACAGGVVPGAGLATGSGASGATTGACVIQTPEAGFALSPSEVADGRSLTGTVTAKLSNETWAWNGFVRAIGGRHAPVCAPNSTTCSVVVRLPADAPGHYDTFAIGVDFPQFGQTGTTIVSDGFVVTGGGRLELSGRVTRSGADGASTIGVAGVTVRASGPVTKETTTDASGHYSLLLRRGSYTVTAGADAVPAERRVALERDVHGVDFVASSAAIELQSTSAGRLTQDGQPIAGVFEAVGGGCTCAARASTRAAARSTSGSATSRSRRRRTWSAARSWPTSR